MIRLRRPRNLILQHALCYYRPKPGQRPKCMAYGSVWVEVLTQRELPRNLLAEAKQDIARSVRKDRLTFAQWAPVFTRYNPTYRGYLHTITADVVWNDAYEKVQVGP